MKDATNIRVFKTRPFDKWASSEGVTDEALLEAVDEIERGLVDARLGGHLVKKRVAVGGRGKRAGVRTILAYKRGDRVFFLDGFAKKDKDNVGRKELLKFKERAAQLIGYNAEELEARVGDGRLIEVKENVWNDRISSHT